MRAAYLGSARGLAVWMGTAAYLTYNAVMFCFATPFNRLFPLYVAMLSLSVFLLAGLARPRSCRRSRARRRPDAPGGSRSTSGWSSP